MSNIDFLIQYEQFYHYYQPLYDLTEEKKRYGYEGLLRSKVYSDPEFFFRLAKEADSLYELDTKSISKAVLSYYLYGSRDPLFLNVFPSTLLSPSFQSFLENLMEHVSIPNHHIVFEINEAEDLSNLDNLRSRTMGLKNKGFLIAVDDVGRGSASLRTITELEPDFIKVDRYFSKNLATSEKKQRMIQFLVHYCLDDIRLVLEGIEKREDLLTAKALGVSIGQGFLLGKPAFIKEVI